MPVGNARGRGLKFFRSAAHGLFQQRVRLRFGLAREFFHQFVCLSQIALGVLAQLFQPFRQLHVLLVEDVELNIALAEQIFSSFYGFKPDIARNGLEAIEKVLEPGSSGPRTPDIGGKSRTSDLGKAIAESV